MNLAITPSTTLPEKRFTSSATFGMLAIVTALVLITAVDTGGISTLIVLALPVTLFVLSLTSVTTLKARRNARADAIAATRTSETECATPTEVYFPSWLGSKAYATACGTEQD